jgi:hypothetical protein
MDPSEVASGKGSAKQISNGIQELSYGGNEDAFDSSL